MNALTIRQPHAQLIVVGAKPIETRGWRPSPDAVGQPLIIHAGKAKPEVEMMEDGYAGEIGDMDARWFQWCQGEDAPASGDWYLYDCTAHGGETPTPGEQWVMPLGAIVATCVLAAVLPIVKCATDMLAPEHVCVSGLDVLHHRPADNPFPDGLTEHVIVGAAPFGDYSTDERRYAWLLEDVKSTTERCPACWGRGCEPDPYPDYYMPGSKVEHPCTFCAADPRDVSTFTNDRGCDPIRATGRQGLWHWVPEMVAA